MIWVQRPNMSRNWNERLHFLSKEACKAFVKKVVVSNIKANYIRNTMVFQEIPVALDTHLFFSSHYLSPSAMNWTSPTSAERLVKFIMYMRTMERTSTWKVEIQEPNTPASKTRSRRRVCRSGSRWDDDDMTTIAPPKKIANKKGFGPTYGWG